MWGLSCDHYLFHLGTVPVTLDSEPSLQHLMEKVAAYDSSQVRDGGTSTWSHTSPASSDRPSPTKLRGTPQSIW